MTAEFGLYPADPEEELPCGELLKREVASTFDALFGLAAALGYRLELRALGGKQRAR